VRASPVIVAAVCLIAHGDLAAQAPPAAGLWRVAATSLAVPAALQGGETGAFWNPAASAGARGIGLGVHAVHTGSTLGLSAVLGAGSVAIGGPLRAGVVLGRVQIRDLVRTTTSPDSRDGSIPVYEQFAGATLAGSLGPVQLGTQLQIHESRFDAESETGFVLDFGVRSHPLPRLDVAASTHLLPVGFGSDPATDYFLGAEYLVVDRSGRGGLESRVLARYGATLQARGAWEHTIGVGAEFAGIVSLDLAVASESGYGSREWRPSMALQLRFGGYRVALAHGLGINDAGSTLRVGLDMVLGH